MKNTAKFIAWPKIPRSHGAMITITEKLDGTNACIVIEEGEVTGVQSRKRMITPESDNFGFAQWVSDNEEELLKLGDGHHFGEWVGPGIQKNHYDLSEKTFFLFNTKRWGSHNPNTPECCEVVPVLYVGADGGNTSSLAMSALKETGSHVETGPSYKGYVEGIIVFHDNLQSYTKDTYEYREGKYKGK